MSTDTKTRNVVVNRVINAPVDQVWKVWSDSNYVKQWWGPTGFTCRLPKWIFMKAEHRCFACAHQKNSAA